VVAKRNGIGVRRITFWLFGGVSELESEALTPGEDFRIAAAGPATSFVLAGAFGVLGLLVHQIGGGQAVLVSALGWLAWMNLILGGFNLIPAAPLDGGRVLRAALWRRSGDRVRAATTATRAGQAFAYVLATWGILLLLAGGLIGLWFVFLGWFLLTAARSEENSVIMRTSLAGVHVRDIMTPDPVTFAPTTTVADLIDSGLEHHRFSSYPLVGADGELEGLSTMSRIRQVPPTMRLTTRLIDIACPPSDVPRATPGEPIADLLQRMQASPDGRALVFDGVGHIVGVVSPSDISRYVQLCMLRSQGVSSRKK
jgi:Zn-dependent protease